MSSGHLRIKYDIATDGLPRVSVFSGPASVGKRAVAKEALQLIGIQPADTFWGSSRLTAVEAREAVAFAHVAPRLGTQRALVLAIDGASPSAYTALLKTLEDDLPLRVILLSRGIAELPHTLASRATVFRFGLLSNSQVVEVLTTHYRFQPETAKELAVRSGGTVSGALAAVRVGKPKLGVLAAVRAIQERDSETLLRVATDWTDEHTETLVAWCNEAVTRRWRIFIEDEVGPTRGFKLPLKILTALSLAETRPKLVVRAALMDVLTKG